MDSASSKADGSESPKHDLSCADYCAPSWRCVRALLLAVLGICAARFACWSPLQLSASLANGGASLHGVGDRSGLPTLEHPGAGEAMIMGMHQEARLPEFGFIMPRCVRTPTHNELWRENYRCIRALFPRAPIVIIDDYSDMALVDQNFTMTDAVVVPSELPPGKGEALPYLYFHKHRPFKKAVMLNDGMFILRRAAIGQALKETADYRFLWHFDRYRDYLAEATQYAVQHLLPEVQSQLMELFYNAEEWLGCFASASIMTWEFLDHLNTTYGFLGMLDAIETRDHRMGLERVVALVATDATGGIRPLHESNYTRDRAAGILNDPAIKIWNGRRRRRQRRRRRRHLSSET